MPLVLPVPLSELIHLLSTHYGIAATSIVPLALDHAPASLIALVETLSGQTFFLKFKREIVPGSLSIASLLYARSIPVLAPLPSLSHRLSVPVGDFFLVLYPFLNARPVDHRSLTPEQWRNLGLTLRRIHETPLSKVLLAAIPHATFIPWGELFLAECTEAFTHREQALQTLWQVHQDLLTNFFSFTQELGIAASLAAPTFHLCHNDFHSDNVLLNPASGDLTIIDWDNPMWGPRERDLLFIAPEDRPAFEVGYGPIEEVPEVARYVHADWLLQDLLDCFSRLLSPELSLLDRAWVLDSIATIVPRMRTSISYIR